MKSRILQLSCVCLVAGLAFACDSGGRPSIESVNQANIAIDTTDSSDGESAAKGATLLLSGLPEGRTNQVSFALEVTSTGFVGYRFKLGPAELVRCAENKAYSTVRDFSEPLNLDTSEHEDGYIKLCLLGIEADGKQQELSQAKQIVWVRETKPAEVIELSEEVKASTPAEKEANPFVVDCSQESVLKTTNSDIPRTLRFLNVEGNDGTDQVYNIYWINYEGQRVFYATINPGVGVEIASFETVPWLIGDAAGNCKGIYLTVQDDVYIIDLD